MADARQVAHWIVDDLVRYLSDHKGLGNEWDAIDDGNKQEVRSTWIDAVEAYVKKYNPKE